MCLRGSRTSLWRCRSDAASPLAPLAPPHARVGVLARVGVVAHVSALDRGGRPYAWVYRLDGGYFSSAAPFSGTREPIYRLSPTRQQEKALGLSGRQRKRWRKAQRRRA